MLAIAEEAHRCEDSLQAVESVKAAAWEEAA